MIETAIDYKVLYEESALEIASLKHELANLKRLIFGSKNERFVPSNSSSSQLSLDIEAEEVAQCSLIKAQKIEYIRHTTEIKKEHPGRTPLPEHLERREIVIEPSEKTEGCNPIINAIIMATMLVPESERTSCSCLMQGYCVFCKCRRFRFILLSIFYEL